MKRKKFVSYEDGLQERLKDIEYAAAYLNAHLEDENLDERVDDKIEAFLLALRDVAIAQGIGKISKHSQLGRESLYKTLSKSGNPKISTLAALLNAMGLKMSIETKNIRKSKVS